MTEHSVSQTFDELSRSGVTVRHVRELAIERPVAIELNGVGYAVLMASPFDLHDLVIGFVLAERLVDGRDDVVDVDVHDHPAGWIIRVRLSPGVATRVFDRVRHRSSDGSCGLCGIENLEQAIRPLPSVRQPFRGRTESVFAALDALRERQPINRATGAVHAAALCDAEGRIRLVREDVGRHNAFDKLIGAMVRAGLDWDGGFALLTSRCSFELVEKAALAGCPLLATISAPTSLAVARAAEAGLPLVTLARPDSVLVAR